MGKRNQSPGSLPLRLGLLQHVEDSFQIAMSHRNEHNAAVLDRLIAADPLERLLATMDVEIRLRTRRFTNSQVSLELELLRSFRADLEEALRDARATEVIGNVKDAAKLTGRGESTVRRVCKDTGEKAGAVLVAGEWSIHLPTFMKFISHMPVRAATRHPDAGALESVEPVSTKVHDRDNTLDEAA